VGARETARGGARRAIAVRTASEERLLVGPDNGLLALAAERFEGAVEAVDIGLSPRRLEPVSQTFHGRDIFAPVAAARVEDGALVAHALTIDRFGNVALNVDHEQLASFGLRLGAPVTLSCGERTLQALYASTFADVAPGAPLVYEDAQRTLAIAINRGSAATELGIERDDELRIAPA
jgi:S-adenosylmethionine hydrolase